ncbi:MAG: prepilin-type N-terminal cleavage/methylation domain-containing protein [Elusimicrobiaceae bacterium]|nr:prepilin-type N-terminal cleavage/methylation domain-containing protein [Elusimicrobiaceae bacterium]
MKKGFTLIELLIVVVIVGTLMAVAVPKYRVALESGRSREGVVYMKALADDLNTYYWMWGRYPTTGDYWNDLSERDLPKLTYFTRQTVGRGCTDKSCVISVERDGGDMYSIETLLSSGETTSMRCSSCLQTSANSVTCNPNRASYKRYCNVVGKKTRYETSLGYAEEYMIIGDRFQ